MKNKLIFNTTKTFICLLLWITFSLFQEKKGLWVQTKVNLKSANWLETVQYQSPIYIAKIPIFQLENFKLEENILLKEPTWKKNTEIFRD